jgi:hypothetical protein
VSASPLSSERKSSKIWESLVRSQLAVYSGVFERVSIFFFFFPALMSSTPDSKTLKEEEREELFGKIRVRDLCPCDGLG